MQIVPLIDPYAIHQDGKDDLTGDWVISTHSITLTAGTLTAEQLTSTDDLTVGDDITLGGDIKSSGAIDLRPNGASEKIRITFDGSNLILRSYDDGLVIKSDTGTVSFDDDIITTSGNIQTSGSGDIISADGVRAGGKLTASRGTASAPSITFTGDNNTGLSVAVEDILVLSTGASARLDLRNTVINAYVPFDLNANAITNATNTNWDAAYTHIGESGASHTYIDQDLRIAASPSFALVTSDFYVNSNLYHTGDLDTGIFFFDNQFQYLCGGYNMVKMVTAKKSYIVINEDGEDVDFRIESDTNDRIFFVDAGNNKVFLGDGGVTNYSEFSSDGSLALKGSATLEVGTVQTYAESNVTADRTFDADTVAIAELADIIGTLIVDLRAIGLVN